MSWLRASFSTLSLNGSIAERAGKGAPHRSSGAKGAVRGNADIGCDHFRFRNLFANHRERLQGKLFSSLFLICS